MFFDKSTKFLIQIFSFAGDTELIAFLTDEIKLEKESEKSAGKAPKIRGFEITSTDGPNVVLTRKLENET